MSKFNFLTALLLFSIMLPRMLPRIVLPVEPISFDDLLLLTLMGVYPDALRFS